MLSSQFFSGGRVVSYPPGWFCNDVVSTDVAKPGELTSGHGCRQGFLLSSKGVHLLSHIVVCLVLSIRTVEESPEAFRF